uniref:Z-ring associated protein G n=1 Tax=Candidatus Kentrum sp. TC TaxID=2126339 RepID=A0A450YV82_9GAMM|nr:MAG: hypothetical protein BECKTC1821E_GA0114239_104814 [Candidatus Kentron sp. TC]VFK47858.1 MAG: hypothetical protein BECKTC1821D_GA0114238_10533 [Candidatus Kentron sp. TC]VFK59509.1 MAG: hypothetical protein BECKTC1821F_GA0114240_103418 [Candidatus Kentron sp. TC]
MTEYNEAWFFGIGTAALIAGMGLGMLIAYFLLPGAKRAKALQKDLDNMTAEFARYRERVAEHFSKTANLFHDLTTQYRGLYDHLASGAQDLCREASDAPRLDFADVGLLPNRESQSGPVPGSPGPLSDTQGKDSGKSDAEWEGGVADEARTGEAPSSDRKGDGVV